MGGHERPAQVAEQQCQSGIDWLCWNAAVLSQAAKGNSRALTSVVRQLGIPGSPASLAEQ